MLLGQRLTSAATHIARSLREQLELVPPNPASEDRLFETALRGRTLEAPAGVFGQTRALDEKKVDRVMGIAKGHFALDSENRAAPGNLPAEVAAGMVVDNDEMRSVLDRQNRGYAFSMDAGYFGRGEVVASRARVRAYFREVGPSKEWAENNYYHLRMTQQDGALIPVNGYWRDYAQWSADGAHGGFVSPNIAEACHNFAEMMLALAVLDLPFDLPQHVKQTVAGRFTLTVGGPVIAFHKELKPSAPLAAHVALPPLRVTQSFFRADDRFRVDGHDKVEKSVSGEFLTGIAYGANVVVTNPTSAPADAEVLVQIPQGALPVLGCKATDSRSLRLEPYTTQTFEYDFYFPTPAGPKGFSQFPANVAVTGMVLGAAQSVVFNVVAELTLKRSPWRSQGQTDFSYGSWEAGERGCLCC